MLHRISIFTFVFLCSVMGQAKSPGRLLLIEGMHWADVLQGEADFFERKLRESFEADDIVRVNARNLSDLRQKLSALDERPFSHVMIVAHGRGWSEHPIMLIGDEIVELHAGNALSINMTQNAKIFLMACQLFSKEENHHHIIQFLKIKNGEIFGFEKPVMVDYFLKKTFYEQLSLQAKAAMHPKIIVGFSNPLKLRVRNALGWLSTVFWVQTKLAPNFLNSKWSTLSRVASVVAMAALWFNKTESGENGYVCVVRDGVSGAYVPTSGVDYWEHFSSERLLTR